MTIAPVYPPYHLAVAETDLCAERGMEMLRTICKLHCLASTVDRNGDLMDMETANDLSRFRVSNVLNIKGACTYCLRGMCGKLTMWYIVDTREGGRRIVVGTSKADMKIDRQNGALEVIKEGR